MVLRFCRAAADRSCLLFKPFRQYVYQSEPEVFFRVPSIG